MRRSNVIGLCAAAGAALAAAPALAEIYKWIDEKGVVNYSESAPAGRSARLLPLDAGKVSVVPTDPRVLEQARESEQSALKRRVDQLEDELARSRAEQYAEDRLRTQRLARWREECRAQRNVDCDDELRSPYETLYFPPVIVVHPHRPRWPHKPSLRPAPHGHAPAAPRPETAPGTRPGSRDAGRAHPSARGMNWGSQR